MNIISQVMILLIYFRLKVKVCYFKAVSMFFLL